MDKNKLNGIQQSVLDILSPYSIPPGQIPEVKTIDISLEDIKKLSNEELLKITAGESKQHQGFLPISTMQIVLFELQTRETQAQIESLRAEVSKSAKPHMVEYAILAIAIITLALGIWAELKPETQAPVASAPAALPENPGTANASATPTLTEHSTQPPLHSALPAPTSPQQPTGEPPAAD